MRRCRVRLCVPHGGARHRARRCTQVRCRRRLQRRQRRPDGDGSKRKRGRIARRCGSVGIRAEPGEATMARLSPRAAPRHFVSMRRAPCHRRFPRAVCVASSPRVNGL
ncbi:hypothetical protein Ctob_011965, partial [Chrysochromulina tobinii]